MEEKDIFVSGHVVKGDEAPEGFHVAQRTENSFQFFGPTEEPPAPAPAPAPAAAVVMPGTDGKKKRGRPKKIRPPFDNVRPYPISASNGKAAALAPTPISSIPFTGDFPAWKGGVDRTVGSVKNVVYTDVESAAGPGDGIAYSVGANFTAHILTVNAGEDVTMKIMSFSQQGYHAICILSANGTISNVTLRQPTSSGGTLTYEGRFEILSLSGSFMPAENGFTRSRSGGMSVSLAGPDGRVMGGGLAGLLVAASPVQVVVGTFVPGHHHPPKQKPKKQRVEQHTSSIAPPPHINTVSADEIRISLGGVAPIMATPAAFRVDNNNIASFNNGQGGSRGSSADDDNDESPLHDRDSNPSLSDAGVAW